ncbi:MAG: hypothetical protein WKG00_21005 [Polyangiaceae bacterium]
MTRRLDWTAAQAARTARARQRGAAVFIVVLVITMLTGVGLFAVRSAILSTTVSGYSRQMSQTHFITDYAMLAAAAELSTNRRDAYVEDMKKSDNCVTVLDCKCKGVIRTGNTTSLVSNHTCYLFGPQDLQQQLTKETSSAVFLTPTDVSDPANPVAGSLGHGNLEAGFLVEMTDLAPASPPVAGLDLTSAGAAQVQFMSVTMHATGQVRPPGSVTEQRSAASIETSRAHLIVGPLKK